MTNNTSLLTRSHAVYAAKKRAKRTQVKEVVFDEDARRYVRLLFIGAATEFDPYICQPQGVSDRFSKAKFNEKGGQTKACS